MPRYTEKVATWVTDLFGTTGVDAHARFHMEEYKNYTDPHWRGAEAFVAYDWKRLWLKTRGWPLFCVIMAPIILIGFVELAVEWMYARWCDDEWSCHERSFRFIADIRTGHLNLDRHMRLRNQVDPHHEFGSYSNMIHNLSGFYGRRLSSILYADCPGKERTTVGAFIKDYNGYWSVSSLTLRLAQALRIPPNFNCWVYPPKYDWLWRPKTIERLTVLIDFVLIAAGWYWVSWWLTLIVLVSWWYVVIFYVKS